MVELEGEALTRQYADLVDPAPGDHRTVTFAVKTGSTLTVRVIDPEALAVPNASVSAQWMEGAAWRRLDRRTNTEGNAAFEGLPPAAVWFRARAAGFVPNLLPQLETNLHDGSPILARLERAGVVEGRCLLEGKPARDFTVNFWKKEPRDGGKVEVRGSADGSFRVDEAAPGELVLFAMGTTSIQSPQVRVVVDTAKPTKCVLELPAPCTATGRVVAGMTGEPIPSARVALQVRVGSQILRPWKEASPVDVTGAFSIRGLAPGLNYVRITADGFAPRVVHADVGEEGRVDLGSIGLHQHGSIEVRLVGAPDQDLSAIRVDLQGIDPRPFVPVPSNGIVHFDGLMPGSYSPRIVFKDNSSRFLTAHVTPGRRVRVSTPISEEGIEVAVEPGTPEIAERLYELRVTFVDRMGVESDEFYPIRRERSVRVRTLDTKRIYLEANDRDGVVLGVGRFELTGTQGEVVNFRVEGRSPVLRIVDRARKPVAGARVGVVGVVGAEMDLSWARFSFTDGDGLCVLEGLTFETVGISLFHPDLGSTSVKIVELPRDRTEPLELVLDAPLELRVQVLDHAARLPGIELFARDLGRSEDGLGPGTSDAAGLAKWSQVAAGTYEVSVVHPGVWPDSARVEVNDSEEPVPFQVRRLGHVQFRVSTTLGNPVRGARFELHSVERGASVATWIAEGAVPSPVNGLVTDERGELAVRGLPNGEFRYRATLPNGNVLDGVVIVPPSATIDVLLRVE
ncbi:MAG: carboxypeptidase regulatory-like domain-containing protein [Planctomycetes bacterium]|nr:carboxypeptidase regulatory-like domain-containing protein [Planctomycetota bacterium]